MTMPLPFFVRLRRRTQTRFILGRNKRYVLTLRAIDTGVLSDSAALNRKGKSMSLVLLKEFVTVACNCCICHIRCKL